MSSTPAGWYPDNQGQMRYWDGAAWTEHVAHPTPPPPPPAAPAFAPPAEKSGAFAKMRNAREQRVLNQAEAATAAGSMVTSGVFGTSTIEIYQGGYVRVASGERPDFMGRTSRPGRSMSPGATVSMKKSTPYERLISIKFTPSTQDQKSGGSSPLQSAVGPTMAKVMKGGKSALKGSLPGLAATGIAHVASTESRTSYLTITTDREVHQLTNQGHNGYIKTTNKAHVDVGLALEAAGNAVLAGTGTSSGPFATNAQEIAALPAKTASASDSPSVAGRLRELAELQRDGILTDEEFAAAKAKLLGGL